MNKKVIVLMFGVFALLFFAGFASSFVETVPAGHVGVKQAFGDVQMDELPEGLNFKAPWVDVYHMNGRNQSLKIENVGVPSQDQLTTTVDVSIQWSIDKSLAAEAYQQTGTIEQLENVHLLPTTRSLLREAGKSVARAEDFYKEETQRNMQVALHDGLQSLREKGIIVEGVLLRRFDLPKFIVQAIESKKQREQEAERQKAEYDRFKIEQQQKIAQAEAEKNAAAEEAERRRIQADAKAYEITAEAEARAQAIRIEGAALRESPDVVKLRAVEGWDGVLPKYIMGDMADVSLLMQTE